MSQSQAAASLDALAGPYRGYGLALFVDERGDSDEFIVYMEETTIPGIGEGHAPDDPHEPEDYAIHLLADDGTPTPVGRAHPDVCCGHADELEPGDDPHDGKLVFNYEHPDGANLLARFSGVRLTHDGQVAFEDRLNASSLPALRALLVRDPAAGYPGWAVRLKDQAARLSALADEVEAGGASALAARAPEVFALIAAPEDDRGVYRALSRALESARRAAAPADVKPSIPLRFKEIEANYDAVSQKVYRAAYEAWNAAELGVDARVLGNAVRATRALSSQLVAFYKLCQQMGWLAPSIPLSR